MDEQKITNFHGILIEEDEYIFPRSSNHYVFPSTEQQDFIDGLEYICDWVKSHENDYSEADEEVFAYKKAVQAVELYKSWKSKYGSNLKVISNKIIRETISPAIDFVRQWEDKKREQVEINK